MDTSQVRKEIVSKIERINDPAALESLDFIVDDLLAKSLGNDFWDDLPATLKEGIEKAEKDLQAGKGISHKDVLSEVRKKYC